MTIREDKYIQRLLKYIENKGIISQTDLNKVFYSENLKTYLLFLLEIKKIERIQINKKIGYRMRSIEYELFKAKRR